MRDAEESRGNRDQISESEKDQSWIPKFFKKRVCSTFVEDSSSDGSRCQCGGARNEHSEVALGDCFSTAIVNHWESAQHSSEYPTDAFGELRFPGASKKRSHFLRLSKDSDPSLVYTLMTTHWELPPPNLVVSVVGGEGQTKVKPWVREVIRQGLVKASQSTGAWIITTGLREGIGKCVGEAVRDHATAASSVTMNKVVALGIAPWGLVHKRDLLVNPEGSFPAKYYARPSPSCYLLDNNYQAFLLVDDGRLGNTTGETGFRAKLEDYISHQRTGIYGSGSIDIPVLCILVSGDASMLERVEQSLRNSIPWLVLAGSGGLADFLSDALENLSSAPVVQSSGKGDSESGPKVEMKEIMAERVKKHFPLDAETDKLVEQALYIYNNRGFVTIYHGEQEGPNDFDKVLLKALVGASKQRPSVEASPDIFKLKLAVTWNRVDIAKSELFNGNIRWQFDDLEESMTDALINNKPKFVRLFIENGLDITEYLTYGRLEILYRSVLEGTLVYQLLLRRLERQGTTVNGAPRPSSPDNPNVSAEKPLIGPVMDITLFEVSGVLEMLMGDVCKPFYYDAYNTVGKQQSASRRQAIKHVSKILRGDCLYRNSFCLYPWASLFIWAVLQNRQEMATLFWEMVEEPVLTALSGCKILRELSKLETETETKLSLKENAQKFEDFAHDIFSSCYQTDETCSFNLLIRQSSHWGGATCLQMGMGADARLFFSHDGVQSLLSKIWWGDMKRDTAVWKLLLTFFCPVLCYTNLISFSEAEEHDAPTPRTGPIKGRAHDRHPKQPFIVSRWRHFWVAPVTSFLGNVFMYFFFLGLYAYVLLVDFKPPPPAGPAVAECFLYFWVFTMACEEIRESFFQGTMPLQQRLSVYIQDVWNKCDVTAIMLFIIGLTLRMFHWSYGLGRDVLCVDYMVFTLRLIHIFAINKHLGPKIIMVGKMMKDVFFFLLFLGVWLMAYGVANQALIYSYDPRLDRILRRVFYMPYLLIFGEMSLEEIDVFAKDGDMSCTDNVTLIDGGEEPCRSIDNNWLVVILLVIYLLVTNILLINLLIAMFSYTFSEVQANSDIYWKFQRYNLIVEYHNRPALAPPFIIISHINLFIKRNIRKVPSVKNRHFALELKGKAADKIMTLETLQKEDYITAQKEKSKSSDSERLKRMSDKVDTVVKHLSETRDLDLRLRALENELIKHLNEKRDLDFRLSALENSLDWIVDTLVHSSTFKPPRPPPKSRDLFTPSSNL